MAEKYKIQGIIKRVSEIQKINNFEKQDFILETGTNEHPNPIKFQTSGKYLGYVNNQMIGRTVEVGFYINGNAVPKKGYFNNLAAVSIQII